MHLEMNVVPLAAVVQGAIDALKPHAEESGVRIRLSLDKSVLVRGDLERLQQVAANLISNAVKFTPPEGVVSVEVRSAADAAELVVSDTGPGIPSDLLPHVFEWFRQGDAEATQRHSGLGLGLGIVRQLVELHGGHVEAESSPGRGATFTVWLPQADSAEALVSLERSHSAAVIQRMADPPARPADFPG
jgi:signal transduction histidine kinase